MKQSIDSTRLDRQFTIISILHIRLTKSTHQVTDRRSCRLLTIDTMEVCLSDQELIVSINSLSSVSIDHDRYDLRVFSRPRVDCVYQMTV